MKGGVSVKFTAVEQHRINKCYAHMKAALDELAQILHKDSALITVQHNMYCMEDTLHQYVIPVKKEAQ